MKHSHVFKPEHVAVLEAEDRKIWQNPDEIIGAIELHPGFVAADLGCGSGYFTVPLAQRVKKVYAIDIQDEMLEFLKKKIKKMKIMNIEPLLSRPGEIPLGDESIDLLLSVNTLHEFRSKDKMIREMIRVVKKGGKLLIVDFKKEETEFGPPVEIRVSKAQAIRRFQAKGLRFSKTKDLPYHYLLVFTKN
jgi:ubiquinone/menaquinone biosynthesis C-methylase UbiE